MSNADRKSLLSSTGLVSGFTLLSRVLGLVRDSIMAHFLGTSLAQTIFQIAFEIPHFLRRVIGEGALSAFIIPIYSEEKNKKGDAGGWYFVNNTLNIFLALSLVVTIVFCLFPQPLFFLYGGAKYLAQGDEASWLLGNQLVRIMFPFVLLLTLTSILMGILHAHKHFLAPAMGSIVLNLSMILVGVYFIYQKNNIGFIDEGSFVYALAWFVVVGATVRLLILLPPLLARGWRWRPVFNYRDGSFLELLTKLPPAFLGLAIFQLNIMIVNTLAVWISDESVVYLRYSNRLMQFPLALVATALSTAILPQLTEFIQSDSRERLKNHIAFANRILFIGYLPATAGLIALGRPIIQLLFQSGQWTAAATTNTHLALIFFALGLLPVGLQRILTPVYYAEKDVKTPVKYGAITVVINSTLCLALMFTPLTYMGLALASSLSAAFNTWLLFRGKRDLIGDFFTAKNVRTLTITSISALIMGIVCSTGYGFCQAFLNWDGRLLLGCLVFIWVVIGAAVYFAACWMLKLNELNFIKELIANKLGSAQK